MRVKPEEVYSSMEHGGHVIYFCSKECEEEFKKNPEKYISEIRDSKPKSPMHHH